MYRGPRNIRSEDIEKPKPSQGETLVRFLAGSICGTDLHLYRGEWTWMKPGTVMGHDACGVEESTGRRVVMIPVVYCGTCYYCMQGLFTLCEKSKVMGFSRDGFFAEHVAIPSQNLVPAPQDVSDEEAAIIEPVVLAIRTLNSLQPRMADYVTVVGQGPIGIVMTQLAKLKGCRVIAVDVQEHRLELSEKYGADVCVNAAQEDVVEAVRRVTGRGSDIVVETAGTRRTVEQTPFLVRRAGKVALLGESKGFLDLEKADEVQFSTFYISPLEYPLALDLVSRKMVDVKGLVSHRFRLQDFEKALQTADNPAERPVKVVVTA